MLAVKVVFNIPCLKDAMQGYAVLLVQVQLLYTAVSRISLRFQQQALTNSSRRTALSLRL